MYVSDSYKLVVICCFTLVCMKLPWHDLFNYFVRMILLKVLKEKKSIKRLSSKKCKNNTNNFKLVDENNTRIYFLKN